MEDTDYMENIYKSTDEAGFRGGDLVQCGNP